MTSPRVTDVKPGEDCPEGHKLRAVPRKWELGTMILKAAVGGKRQGHHGPGASRCPQVPLGALRRQDLLHVVDDIAVQLGGSGREGLLGKGPGHLAATHHRMV